jgi:hypothetical protein
LHTEEAVVSAKLPASHEAHAAFEGKSRDQVQELLADAPKAPMWPFGHALHVPRPEMSLNVPASQAKHTP